MQQGKEEGAKEQVKPQLRPQSLTPSNFSLPPATPDVPQPFPHHINTILDLQRLNYNYQCQLGQLRTTMDKLLQNTKVNSKLNRSKTQLHTKLSSVNKEIQSKTKFIEIKKKELQGQKNKDGANKVYDSLVECRFAIEDKKLQLVQLRKSVKALDKLNNGIQQKLLQYSLKNKQKSFDVHFTMIKELVAENHNLRLKLEKYNSKELKREKQTITKKKSQSLLKRRGSLIPLLPEISSRNSVVGKRRSVGDLAKLETEKDIYTKFLSSRKPRIQEQLSKEIKDATGKQEEVKSKIIINEQSVMKLKQKIAELKAVVGPEMKERIKGSIQKSQELPPKMVNASAGCDMKWRNQRRDWIGKFGGQRFSDSRIIRAETRICKIVYNDLGYYQFYYYFLHNPKEIVAGNLPFNKAQFTQTGKETTFRVDYPDYIKEFKVRISTTHQTITQLSATSNAGLSSSFPNQMASTATKISLEKKKTKPVAGHAFLNYYPPQEFLEYSYDIQPNQAPTLMFGSYTAKYDEKKHLIRVSLEGLGVQIIEENGLTH